MPLPKPLSKEDILRAMRFTKSNRAAAKYLGCSYQHYKPFAKLFKVDEADPNSPTLFDVHKNQSGKGIPKFITDSHLSKIAPIEEIVNGLTAQSIGS